MSFLLYKPAGLTPLQALSLAKKQFPQYSTSRLGAAGRLDPMAEGLLLVMVDDENKKQKSFLALDKVYEVEMILGISTDSYDLLGLPLSEKQWDAKLDQQQFQKVLAKFTGTIAQAYPPFSAVRVQGKPLYWWAREGRLDDINIPSASRKVYRLDLIDDWVMNSDALLREIRERVGSVEGEFRQEKILKSWASLLEGNAMQYQVVKLQIECSSGTYVRSLVDVIGTQLTVGATTRRIMRTKVGHHQIKDALHLDY